MTQIVLYKSSPIEVYKFSGKIYSFVDKLNFSRKIIFFALGTTVLLLSIFLSINVYYGLKYNLNNYLSKTDSHISAPASLPYSKYSLEPKK
jgi:hypothetical protein